MNRNKYATLLAEYRDRAHKMMFSKTTVDSFAEKATFRQLAGVVDILRIELDTRAENKRLRLQHKAGFPTLKSLQSFDFLGLQYQDGYGTDELCSLEFIEKAENLVLYGPSGRGKSHLAIALGITACNKGYEVRFFTASDLVYALSKAHKDNTLDKLYAGLERADMIILDEFGYIPFDADGARLLFQVISKSYETRSLVFTTNIEFSHWGTILADDKLAAAVIDRIVHHGRLVVFKGPNRRMENALMMGKKGGDLSSVC
jgi:DNA replication protein DnaC